MFHYGMKHIQAHYDDNSGNLISEMKNYDNSLTAGQTHSLSK